MPKTGNTGTIAFTVTGVTLSFTKIGEWQATRGKLNVSHLETEDFHELIPDDLADPGEIELEALFDPTEDLADISETVEDITVTYPLDNTGWAVQATLTGSGYVMMVGTPELVNGSVAKQKLKFFFDGKRNQSCFCCIGLQPLIDSFIVSIINQIIICCLIFCNHQFRGDILIKIIVISI